MRRAAVMATLVATVMSACGQPSAQVQSSVVPEIAQAPEPIVEAEPLPPVSPAVDDPAQASNAFTLRCSAEQEVRGEVERYVFNVTVDPAKGEGLITRSAISGGYEELFRTISDRVEKAGVWPDRITLLISGLRIDRRTGKMELGGLAGQCGPADLVPIPERKF